MTKAVCYIRVSMQGQVRDGYSLAYQRDEILRYCTDNDIELMRILEESIYIHGRLVKGVGRCFCSYKCTRSSHGVVSTRRCCRRCYTVGNWACRKQVKVLKLLNR